VKTVRQDLDLDRREVRVLHGKRGKQRVSYLAPWGRVQTLQRMFADVPGEGESPTLFRMKPRGGAYQPLQPITTAAVHLVTSRLIRVTGVRKFAPHDLRRSYITHQLEAGVDAIRLARAVGHASPKTTMLYDRRTAESDRRALTRVEEDD
jgi:integrase